MYTRSLQQGMTLVEALVVIAISTVVLLAITFSIVFFYRTNDYAIEQSLAIASARRGIEDAVRNIREAAYAEDGSYPIVSLGDNAFTFYSDIDKDDNVERVRLFLDGTTFKKGITNPGGNPLTYAGQPEEINILSDDVRNTDEGVNIFDYSSKEGVPVTDYTNVLDVSFVNITLIVNINPRRLPDQFTLQSSATIRNLRPGL